jgi:hypothetical protein
VVLAVPRTSAWMGTATLLQNSVVTLSRVSRAGEMLGNGQIEGKIRVFTLQQESVRKAKKTARFLSCRKAAPLKAIKL